MTRISSFDEIRDNWDERFRDTEDPLRAVMRSEDIDNLNLISEDIATKLSLDTKDSLLEIGCGTGVLLSKLCKNVDKACGVDYSKEAIEKARKLYPPIDFIKCDASDLPMDDNTFDKVLCYSVFHYFPDYAYSMKVIDDLIKICKPGGLILVGDLLSTNHFHLSPYYKKKDYKYYYGLIKSYLKGIIKSQKSIEMPAPYKDTSRWLWFDLPKIQNTLAQRGLKADILSQPIIVQYSDRTHNHRFDLLIKI